MKNLLAVLFITMFAFLVYAEEEAVPEITEGSSTSEAEEALQPVENIEPEETAAVDEEPAETAEAVNTDESAEPEKPAKKSKKSKKSKKAGAVNPNVPGEVNKWILNLGSDFVGVSHFFYDKDLKLKDETGTIIGLPFTTTTLAAGYQLSPQIWIMAKFHLYMTFADDAAAGFFLIGPGIRADFIRTNDITFFGEFFLSFGNEAKTFILSPELFLGVDYNLKSYFSIGAFINFSYQLRPFHVDEKKDPTGTTVVQKEDTITNHCINFILGPRFSVYF